MVITGIPLDHLRHTRAFQEIHNEGMQKAYRKAYRKADRKANARRPPPSP